MMADVRAEVWHQTREQLPPGGTIPDRPLLLSSRARPSRQDPRRPAGRRDAIDKAHAAGTAPMQDFLATYPNGPRRYRPLLGSRPHPTAATTDDTWSGAP